MLIPPISHSQSFIACILAEARNLSLQTDLWCWSNRAIVLCLVQKAHLRAVDVHTYSSLLLHPSRHVPSSKTHHFAQEPLSVIKKKGGRNVRQCICIELLVASTAIACFPWSLSVSHPPHSIKASLQAYLRVCDLEGSAVLEGLQNPWNAFVLIHLEGLVDLLGGGVVW